MSNVNVGIQLYSVKDEITKYGIDEVFAALRDAGCGSVEFAGFYGIPPMEMKAKPLSAAYSSGDFSKSMT